MLSPLLYILVVARLHACLMEAFGPEADQVLDYYADDTLYRQSFNTLRGAVGRVECLLETLGKAGLKINDDKTKVLLRLGGSRAKKILRDEVRNGKRYLRVPYLQPGKIPRGAALI